MNGSERITGEGRELRGPECIMYMYKNIIMKAIVRNIINIV